MKEHQTDPQEQQQERSSTAATFSDTKCTDDAYKLSMSNTDRSVLRGHSTTCAKKRKATTAVLQTLLFVSLAVWQNKSQQHGVGVEALTAATAATSATTGSSSAWKKKPKSSPPETTINTGASASSQSASSSLKHPLTRASKEEFEGTIHVIDDNDNTNQRDGKNDEEFDGKRNTIITRTSESDESIQVYYDPADVDYYEFNNEEKTSSSSGSSGDSKGRRADVLVVAAVDGTLAGISRLTGKTLWKRSKLDLENRPESMLWSTPDDSGRSPTSSSFAANGLWEPLVSTTTTNARSAPGQHQWRTSAVPSIDGKVHLTAPIRDRTASASIGLESDDSANGEEEGEEQALEQVTVTTTVQELVSRVPFVDNRGRIYTGSRRAIAVAMDSTTGQVLQVTSMDHMDTSANDPSSASSSSNKQNPYTVWLGRVDHTITIHEPRTGRLDVQFSAGHIVSVNDMVLSSGTQQPWQASAAAAAATRNMYPRGPLRDDPPLLPAGQDGTSSTLASSQHVLVATPSGWLAYLDTVTQTVVWMAQDVLDSPVAFAVDASRGSSLPVTLVPDAAVPRGSNDYIQREMERQWKRFQLRSSANPSDDDDEETIIGSLPSGQLYAMPLGGPRLGSNDSSRDAGADVNQQQVMIDGQEQGLIGQAERPLLAGRTANSNHPADEDLPCRPGSMQYPSCLFAESAKYPLAQDGAVVPFYHPDFGYLPPEHFYTINNNYPDPNRRKYKKFLRILGSWLPPTIALIFVVSFELGRRKRQKDAKLLLESKTLDINRTQNMDLMTTTVTTDANGAGGVIQVYDDVILGYGAHGTVVYKGLLDGREVAVKRMLKAYHASADREISLLIESDGHANVVRYFLKEVRGDFVYLALELCDLSLHDLILTLRSRNEHSKNIHTSADMGASSSPYQMSLKMILFNVACGVRHLHHLRIVHRDLKPANILLADSRNKKSKTKKSGSESVYEIFFRGFYVAKISDMGLGKQLIGQSSYGASLVNDPSLRGQSNGEKPSVAGAGPGSVGWQAPEVMALRVPSDGSVRSEGSNALPESTESSPPDSSASIRTSRSVDIFSLGCIFYSTLVPGSHPFGEWYEREANIMHNRPKIEALKEISIDAYDLVSAMIQRNPAYRPTAQQICEHPYFWSPERRLSFLCEFSDRLEMDCDTSSKEVTKLLAVEQGAAHVVGTSWDHVLDEELVSNVQRFRTYDPSSVRDLLRLIRNKYHHYDEVSDRLKDILRSKADGLILYFERLFPLLLIHCYRVCRELLPADDPLSVKYCIEQSGHKKRTVEPKASPTLPEIAVVIEEEEPQIQMEIENIVKVETESEKTDSSSGLEVMKQIQVIESDSTPEVDDDIDLISTATSNQSRPLQQHQSSRDSSSNVVSVSITPDEVGDIVIWHNSAAAKTFSNRGWNRSDDEWIRRVDARLRKRDSNLVRCAEDPKFRTRLCNHWDVSYGTFCPMKKKNKCVFAHGPIELRVKDNKRHRWGKLVDECGNCKNPKHSGGEDTYGAARAIETVRKSEGKWNTEMGPPPPGGGTGGGGSSLMMASTNTTPQSKGKGPVVRSSLKKRRPLEQQ